MRRRLNDSRSLLAWEDVMRARSARIHDQALVHGVADMESKVASAARQHPASSHAGEGIAVGWPYASLLKAHRSGIGAVGNREAGSSADAPVKGAGFRHDERLERHARNIERIPEPWQ